MSARANGIAATGERFLPYARQQIDESDIAAVAQVLRGDWLTTGPAVAAFEAALSARLGAGAATVCSSGTAALHIACLALGLGPGQAAIVPTITFLATANAVRMTGAEVVFADVDPASGLMGAAELAETFERAERAGLRVTAVLPVHLGGQCADMAAISALARRHGAAVIEDACHALGSDELLEDGTLSPVGACRHSDMTVFSFHPVKNIAAGEGGAVLTNSPSLARRMKQFRNHGITREPADIREKSQGFDDAGEVNPWYYEMTALGWNYRLSDIHAALGTSQLRRLDEFAATRRRLAELYDSRFAGRRGGVVRQIARNPACHAAWHLYPVLIDFARAGISRARLMRNLHRHGIGTQVHYIPVHRQPYYRDRAPSLDLPGANRYYADTLSLPLFVGMSESEVSRVTEGLWAALGIAGCGEPAT